MVAEGRPAAVHLVRQRVPAHHGGDLAPPGVRRRRLRRPQRRARRARLGAASASTPTRPASTPTGAARSSRSCTPAGARRSPRASSASSPHEAIERDRRALPRRRCARAETDPYDSHPSLAERIAAVEGHARRRARRLAVRHRRAQRRRPAPSAALLEFLLGDERRASSHADRLGRGRRRDLRRPRAASWPSSSRAILAGVTRRHAAGRDRAPRRPRGHDHRPRHRGPRTRLAAGGPRATASLLALERARLDARRRRRPSRSAPRRGDDDARPAPGDPRAAQRRPDRREPGASASTELGVAELPELGAVRRPVASL